MNDTETLISIYKLYKAEKVDEKRLELRDKFFEQLAIILVRGGFKKIDPVSQFKELRQKIESEKIAELTELQRAFDTIQRLLF